MSETVAKTKSDRAGREKEKMGSPRSIETVAYLDAMTTVEVIFNDGRVAVLPLTEKLDKFLAAHKEELRMLRRR